MIPSGSMLMIGGLWRLGHQPALSTSLSYKGKELTVIANDTARPGIGIGKLIRNGQVRRLIASHIGLNPETQKQMHDGSLEVTLLPQGTIVECYWGRGSRPGRHINSHRIRERSSRSTVKEEKIIVKARDLSSRLCMPIMRL